MTTIAKQNINEEENYLDDENEDSQKDKYLTFTVGTEDYGVEICHVTEIIGIQKITEVPDMPEHIKGVINLRGKVIPVMDVRLRFRMPAREYDDRTCIVVVNVAGAAIGLVVDTVKEVADIPPDQIELPPDVAERTTHRYIKGLGKIGEQVKILLDIERLVKKEDLETQAVVNTAPPETHAQAQL